MTNLLVSLAVYLIVLYPLIFESFNATRNILAAFIAIWGYVNLSEKKYITAFLVFLTATLVHYSAAFCFIVWFMCIICNKKELQLKTLLAVIVIGVVSMQIFISFVGEIISSARPYLSSALNDSSGFSLTTTFFYSVVFITSIIFSKKIIHQNPFNKIMIIALGASFVIIPLQFFLPIAGRMLLYAQVPLFFLISGIFSLKLTKRNFFPIFCISAVIVLSILGKFYSSIMKNAVDFGIDNYQNMLF